MIKAEELRIGNKLYLLIKNKAFGEIQRRLILTIKDGKHLDELCDKTKEEQEDIIEPIPLKPEIFEKCGFETVTKTMYKVLNKDLNYVFTIAFTGNGYWVTNVITNYPIVYLHELQNLYFALTGEELEIKSLI